MGHRIYRRALAEVLIARWTAEAAEPGPVARRFGVTGAGTLGALCVTFGIGLLAVAAKTQIPLWPSPVPVTMGSFAVFTLAAAYGPRLGLATILGYMALGVAGADIFAGSSATRHGLAYMTGGTGGYLAGYVLATAFLGLASRRGWDRSVPGLAIAMLAATAMVYAPGLAWLHHLVLTGLYDPADFASPAAQTLAWGITPFLVGDALKLALAALALPTARRLMR